MGKPPVIIIGMHRSGTSMLSRVLEEFGIFMGWKKEKNNEALFFLKFNDWIFRQAYASWDNPYNYVVAGPDFKDLMVNLANKYVKSLRRIEYLGFPSFLIYGSLKELDFPWGWKDPRNTFTLDVWLRVFPNAQIIHIYRNPIDVAESLRKRTLKYKKKFNWNFKNYIQLLLTKGRIGYGDSVRVENILEGINLWKEYVYRVFELERKCDLNFIHIKYEDFLEEPAKFIKKILNKIGLSYEERRIELVSNKVNSSRKYVFLSNEKLIEVYNWIKSEEILQKLGYDNLI